MSDGAFLVREAQARGIPYSRMRHADLAAPFRGVRVRTGDAAFSAASDPDELPWDTAHRLALARARELMPYLTRGMALSHQTAAHAHGMPLPPRLAYDTTVHVSVAAQELRPAIAGVRSHLAPRDVRDLVRVDGLRVTDPVSTWAALASILTVNEIVVMGDHLVRRRSPDATVDGLIEKVRRSAGRYGVVKLRAALELVRPRTDSPRESVLRLLIVDAGLPEPLVNYPLHDRRGRLIRPGDLVYPEQKLVIEYDGEQHRTDAAQYRLDKEQLDLIAEAGWRTIHVLNAHLKEPAVLIARIRHALSTH